MGQEPQRNDTYCKIKNSNYTNIFQITHPCNRDYEVNDEEVPLSHAACAGRNCKVIPWGELNKSKWQIIFCCSGTPEYEHHKNYISVYDFLFIQPVILFPSFGGVIFWTVKKSGRVKKIRIRFMPIRQNPKHPNFF